MKSRDYKSIKCCVPGCDSEKEAPLNVRKWYCSKCVASGKAWRYYYQSKLDKINERRENESTQGNENR
jgi:ribosomal protein L37AE/L43A